MFAQPQMTDLPPEKQAAKAIVHILSRISNYPTLAYFCGHGTETYSLLTEAHATLHGITMAEAQQNWPPASPRELHPGEFLLCPFCGSSHVELSVSSMEPAMECRDCMAVGPECDTEAQAAEKWNTRAMPRS